MHTEISTITHLTTFPGSLTHTLSLILLSNSDQQTNHHYTPILLSLTLILSFSLSLSHIHTSAHIHTLHLIHLGRGKQALPTTILVSVATANQVMSLNRPASRIGDENKHEMVGKETERESNYFEASRQSLRSKGKGQREKVHL